jgi:hypothetical protein
MIKAGHMAHVRDRRNAKLWWGGLQKTDNLENKGIYKRTVLKWTLKDMDKRMQT